MGDAFLCSYFSLYFIERGIPANEQAILLALIPFSMFLGCLLFSSLARTGNRAIWIYRFCLLAEVGLTIGYAFCDSFLSLVILTPIIGMVNSAPFSLIEGYIVPRLEEKGGNYAFVRVFGAIGYAVSLLAGAVLLRYITIHDCFYLSSGFFLGALALSFLLQEKRVEEESLAEKKDVAASSPKRFHLSRGAVFFCLSAALIYGSFNGSSYLFPIRLNQLGFLDADYSLARGVGMVVETAFYFLIPLMAKLFRNKRIPLYACGVLFIVSTLSGVIMTEPWSLAFVFFTLSSIAKAFLFSYEATVLRGIVGEKELSRVLTMSMGLINLNSAILNLFSTTLFEMWGYQGYFGLISGMELLGLGLLFALPRSGKGGAEPSSLENESC